MVHAPLAPTSSADEPSSTSTLTGTTNADYGAVNNPDLHTGELLLLPPQNQAQMKAQGRTPPPAYASLGPNPPPNPWAYTVAFPSSSSSSSSQPQYHDTPAPPSPPITNHASQPHAQFGPTPLSLTHELPYAYIDAPGAADVRAQRRFFGALFLGVGLYLLVGFVVMLEVVGEKGGRVGWYAW